MIARTIVKKFGSTAHVILPIDFMDKKVVVLTEEEYDKIIEKLLKIGE